MAADTINAPVGRERKSFAARIAAFWHRVEPGLDIDRNNLIERWDGGGEGRATAIGFEGAGITLSLHIGRTPPRRLTNQNKGAPRFRPASGSLAATFEGCGS